MTDTCTRCKQTIGYDCGCTEIERLTAERDEWASMVGQIVACLPLQDIVPSSATMGDLIKALKEKIAERDRYKARAEQAEEALEPFAQVAKHHAADAPEWGPFDSVSAQVSIMALKEAMDTLAQIDAEPVKTEGMLDDFNDEAFTIAYLKGVADGKAEPITRDDERDLTLEPTEPRQPTVKPLEWGGFEWDSNADWYIDHAGTSWGRYSIKCESGEYALLRATSIVWEPCDSEQEAYGYAQADYERRILSAIEYRQPTVQEAAQAIMQSKEARDTAFEAVWSVAEKHNLEATNSGGARHSITGDVVNEVYYAALRALAEGDNQ